MAHHKKTHRSKSHHRKSHRSKNMIKKTVNATLNSATLKKGVSIAKSTSKKYMPKVKSGLENVGSQVIDTSKKSVPYLQKKTREFFNLLQSKSKTKKNRKH